MPSLIIKVASDLSPKDLASLLHVVSPQGWLSPLPLRVAGLLGVPATDIILRVVAAPRFTSLTRLPIATGAPTVEVSTDRLTLAIMAHEICHALLPVRVLLLAEGLANWIANQVTGNCGLLFFDAPDYDTVVWRHRTRLPRLGELVLETATSQHWLGEQALASEGGRLANAMAASFCGHCMKHWPGFAASVRGAVHGPAAISQATGLSLEDAESSWWLALAKDRLKC